MIFGKVIASLTILLVISATVSWAQENSTNSTDEALKLSLYNLQGERLALDTIKCIISCFSSSRPVDKIICISNCFGYYRPIRQI